MRIPISNSSLQAFGRIRSVDERPGGGESLQAFALIGRVRDGFGVTLTPRDFFDAGTIAAMATLIRERAPA